MVNKIFCPCQKDFHDISEHLLKPEVQHFMGRFLSFKCLCHAQGLQDCSYFFYLPWRYVKVNPLPYLSLFSVSFHKDEWWPCDFWTPVIGYFRTFFLNRAAFFFFLNFLSILELSIGHITLVLLLWEFLRKKKTIFLKGLSFSVIFFFYSLNSSSLPSFLFLFALEIWWPVGVHSTSVFRVTGTVNILSQ